MKHISKEWRCYECNKIKTDPCILKTDADFDPSECPFGINGNDPKWQKQGKKESTGGVNGIL